MKRKRVHPLLFATLVLALIGAGVGLRPRHSVESRAVAAAPELLDLVPAKSAPEAPPLWKTLLERAAVSTPGGPPTLKLGRVFANPTIARQAAEASGELLLLPAVQGSSELGRPLWQVLLESSAARRTDEGTALELYGCRFSADADAAAAIEDTYYARLALARALRDIVASHPEYGPLTIEGEEIPVHGGANFELQLIGDAHMAQVTVDRDPAAPVGVRRTWRPSAPNDAEARRLLVAGLRQRAATDPAFARLAIEGETAPVPGGVDLRVEALFGRLALDVTLSDGSHLSVSRPWTE